MSTQTIDQPFVSSAALRSVNFFNGRLLTGDDMSREQATQEARVNRLGRAVGDGVAWGFEVVKQKAASPDTSHPIVTVSAGLVVNREGATLELPADVDVALYRDASTAPSGAESGNLFADCQPFATGTYTAGAGVYLLTVAPAEQGEGRAPVNGLGNEAAPCNVALEAEALQFRLIRLALSHDELLDKAHLRNHVAYLCFGIDALAGEIADPFGTPVTSWGLIDTLRTQILTDAEVPLATIGWSIDDGIQFVDLWSVRRRLTRRAAEGGWSSLDSDRRRAEGEAMFLQFQAQFADLLIVAPPEKQTAAMWFELLPPAGLLPLAGTAADGFDYLQFFGALPTQGPAVIEAARMRDLLVDSFAFTPIDLAKGEVVWLYLVHDNLAPSSDEPVDPQRYVLFANGNTRYRANAQFELSYWNFANYAEIG